MTNETEFLLAVGSGSLTDLTRYVAHVAGKPFAVVGTAIVDGWLYFGSGSPDLWQP